MSRKPLLDAVYGKVVFGVVFDCRGKESYKEYTYKRMTLAKAMLDCDELVYDICDSEIRVTSMSVKEAILEEEDNDQIN